MQGPVDYILVAIQIIRPDAGFLQCESKKSPRDFLAFFPKRLGIFCPYFTT